MPTSWQKTSGYHAAVGEKQYMFEAEVEPEFLEEVVDTDNAEDGREKEELLISVADKLMQLGDELQKRKQQQSGKQISHDSKTPEL